LVELGRSCSEVTSQRCSVPSAGFGCMAVRAERDHVARVVWSTEREVINVVDFEDRRAAGGGVGRHSGASIVFALVGCPEEHGVPRSASPPIVVAGRLP
jgi:hypothetical protein